MKLHDLLHPKVPFHLDNWKFGRLVIVILIVISFLPWIAFTTGTGVLTSIDPNERLQGLTAPVDGFVRRWHVKEGDYLKKDQLVAELSDNDPLLLERYDQEKDAAQAALDSATLMKDTARLNMERQRKLYEDGLSARKEYEKAKIEYSKLEMEVSKALVTYTKAQSKYSRQSSQVIRAPRNGWVIRLLPGELGQLINKGTTVAMFSPEVENPAVELWVDGNDAPMLLPGQKTNLQFEGWPSVQVPGWPSVAINTFPGKVHLVDQASMKSGKFRILIIPDGPWPSQNILRVGLQAKGYIRLSDSFILREIWRHLNDFPALSAPYQSELQEMKK